MTAKPLRIVVIAYHAAEQLDISLATLDARSGVTVVDNSSSAEVRAVADRRHAEYVDPGRNLGFGAGVNVALRGILVGEPSDVLLLNPDANITPDALHQLAEILHQPENARVGALSPSLLEPNGTEQRVAWPFPSPWRAWAEAVGLRRLTTGRSDFVIGAVLLLRWEAIVDVGLFDERFFLYAEEADWQRRACDLGWRSKLCPEVVAVHIGAATSGDPRKRELLFHAAQETYIRKWFGSSGWSVYRSAACLGAAARALVLAGERRAEAGRRTLLYLRGPRRCAEAAK